jgi:AcrR family transcriptional regulator
MKTRPAKQNQDNLCDTVAHTIPAPASSSLADPRAVKSGQALRAAMLALLERKPLEQITIREIAAAAGVHYATFFRHHATKESLLDDVAADQIDRLVALTLPVLDEVDWHASFLALAEYVEQHRALWTVLLTGGAAGAMRTELLRVSSEVAHARGALDNTVPMELSVICTVSLIVEIVSWWLRQPAQALSVQQVADLLYRMVVARAIQGAVDTDE